MQKKCKNVKKMEHSNIATGDEKKVYTFIFGTLFSKKFYLCILLLIGRLHATEYLWRTEDRQLAGDGLFIPPCVFDSPTHAVRFGGKHLYPLGNLTSNTRYC